MSRRDPNTIDLAQQPIRLADDLRFWPIQQRGQTAYRIEIPSLHRFFHVGYEEYVFLSLLDGKTTVPQACGLAAATLGSQAPTTEQAQSIVYWLLENELGYLADGEPPTRNRDGDSRATESGFSFASLNPFWMKVPVLKSQRWIAAIANSLRAVFSPATIVFGILLIVVGGVCMAFQWDRFWTQSAQVWSRSNWIWLLSFWVALKCVHELAHAVACHRQGANAREVGVVFVLFAPLAYVDVSSCWRLNSKWARIAVSAAGMYVELVIASAALIAWSMADSASLSFLLHRLVFAAGISTVLFNANALMRFDGYYMLSDWLEIPNLYSVSSQAVEQLLRRILVGTALPSSSLRGWRRHFVLVYGIASLVWRIVICTTLLLAASTMFSGAGIVLVASGIWMFFLRPAKRHALNALNLLQTDLVAFCRAGVVGGGLVATAVALVGWMPIPTSSQAAAVVCFAPETLVRSRVDGFVRRVHVRDQDIVARGDLLMEIENRELTNHRDRLKIEQQQIEIKIRQAIEKKESSERIVLQEHLKSIQEQYDQIASQCDALRVTANRDGIVITRGLDQCVGKFVHQGDLLMTVALPEDKEVMAVVSQSQIEQARPAVGNDVFVRYDEHRHARAYFEKLEPRATDRLVVASLSSIEGGPLSVQSPAATSESDSEHKLRLLEPHFVGRIRLDQHAVKVLPAGLRVKVELNRKTDPLLRRASDKITRLWHTLQQESLR
ncbi:peptidase, M50 family [Rhodopirellula maiorica SM1]|uniref:Peptidase, M50 family n=1 Tax=Rhodopirellula maiorica SM1 TaxID=1265738 RepID=M5S591_9BACT|nr:biotin/lipoyl-binding protein [Rhodopirellula maiorica]EMI21349.1 peptidase, M50 family [Rhodopirellula maiorica SM1]